MISFWERNSFTSYDIIIVGSGITGLSTAASIKEKNPGLSILILERGVFPSGASTKNAGFACFGSITELVADLDVMSKDEMLQLVELRWRGLLTLRNRLGDEKIGLLNQGGYEMITANETKVLDKMDMLNGELSSIFDQPVFSNADENISSFSFNKEVVQHLVFNPYESQIDTGMMMKNLIAYCHELGVDILNGAEIEAINETSDKVEVVTNKQVTFFASQAIITTNAFTKKLYPELTLNPGRGIVLITHPIKDLTIKGTFHYDEGYYYFRDYHGRLLFGGGRNLDFEAETTTDFTINEEILTHLKKLMDEVIIPGKTYEIDHTWAGIMAFGPNKKPIVEKQGQRVFLGVRMGGMGVAIGSMIGEKLSEMVLAER